MKAKPFFILFFLGAQVLTFADRIELKNGQAASTLIVDTSGCKITIKRKDNDVQIEKSQIARIIYGADTISYVDYICPADTVAVKIRKYEETPEYKLYQIMASIPRADVKMEKDQSVIYEPYPLNGSYNKMVFDSVSSKLKCLLSTYGPVEETSTNNIYDCFMVDSAKCPKARYLILPMAIRTDAYASDHYRVSSGTMTEMIFSAVTTPEKAESAALTQIQFICLDLQQNRIVFDESISAEGGNYHFEEPFETMINENLLHKERDIRAKYERQINENIADIVTEFQKKIIKKFE
jgi:hypothetical protein